MKTRLMRILCKRFGHTRPTPLIFDGNEALVEELVLYGSDEWTCPENYVYFGCARCRQNLEGCGRYPHRPIQKRGGNQPTALGPPPTTPPPPSPPKPAKPSRLEKARC